MSVGVSRAVGAEGLTAPVDPEATPFEPAHDVLAGPVPTAAAGVPLAARGSAAGVGGHGDVTGSTDGRGRTSRAGADRQGQGDGDDAPRFLGFGGVIGLTVPFLVKNLGLAIQPPQPTARGRTVPGHYRPHRQDTRTGESDTKAWQPSSPLTQQLRESGQQVEAVGMARPNRVEVAAIQRGDLGDPEPLGDGDDGRVGRAEREVGVNLDQLGHPRVVDQLEIDDREVSCAIERRNAASIFAPPARPSRYPTSATTGAGTRIARRARCRPVNRSVQARLCWSSRSAAATNGPVSQTITQERPKPSASRSSYSLPRSERPLANDPNHGGGHSPTGTDSLCRRASASTAGTRSSDSCSTSRRSSSRSALTALSVAPGALVGGTEAEPPHECWRSPRWSARPRPAARSAPAAPLDAARDGNYVLWFEADRHPVARRRRRRSTNPPTEKPRGNAQVMIPRLRRAGSTVRATTLHAAGSTATWGLPVSSAPIRLVRFGSSPPTRPRGPCTSPLSPASAIRAATAERTGRLVAAKNTPGRSTSKRNR